MWGMRAMRSLLTVPISGLHTTQLRFVNVLEQHTTTEGTNAECSDVVNDENRGSRNIEVKLLFPYYTMPIIIGRKGEAINQLRTGFNTTIWNSGPKVNFPRTRDQVFYIHGAEDDVVKVVEKLSDTQRNTVPPPGISFTERRLKQMRLALPDDFCKKILADDGEIVKEVRNKHGVSIRIGPLPGKTKPHERYMVISEANGDEKKVLEAVIAIMRMVNDDPDITISKQVNNLLLTSKHRPDRN